MSWIQYEGELIFIPSQDYYLEEEELENINPSCFSRPAKAGKVKKKSKAKRKIPDRDNLLLEVAVRENERVKRIDLLASKSVKLQPLNFSDAAHGEASYRNCLEKALAFRDLFAAYVELEASVPREFDESVLASINSLFLENVPPAMKSMVNSKNVGSMYASVLHRFEAELAVETARMMRDCGVMKKFPARKFPMVHCVLQKSIDDFFPHNQCLIPFKVLADLGVVPANALDFVLPGELICFALFWSVCRVHTAFGIIYSRNEKSTEFYWTVYNRGKNMVPVLDRNAFNLKSTNVFNMI